MSNRSSSLFILIKMVRYSKISISLGPLIKIESEPTFEVVVHVY